MSDQQSSTSSDPRPWPALRPGTTEPAHDLPLGFETICAHAGEDPARREGAASPAIYQTSTFIYPSAEAFATRRTSENPCYDYTRCGNPTTTILEKKLAALESGTWSNVFGSGMGAISAAINACVASGSHVVAVAECYGPTRWYLEHLQRFGVETTFVEGVDLAEFVAALRPNTRIVYLESPTSGLFSVPAVEPITRIARERGIVTMFDNSWASPWFYRPLEHGADLVVHSATKFLNGHSDVVAGVVVGRDEQLRHRVAKEVELCGAAIDPFASWLMIRGLRTLALRMQQHQKSALAVARMLSEHPKVDRVLHPGLPSHPHHETARGQLGGYSSLFSFSLKDGSAKKTHAVLDALKLFGIGVSWGGFESLAIGGSFFSRRADRPEWLIRLHVGLETTEDLVADVRQAVDGI